MDVAPTFRSSLGYLKRFFLSLHSCNISLDCEICDLAKSHNHSYVNSLTHNFRAFVLIQSDVWVHAPECGTHGLSYFVLFVDDCARVESIF